MPHIQTLRFLSFFFNDTATTEIYTLSLHDALPISVKRIPAIAAAAKKIAVARRAKPRDAGGFLCGRDRKSTRLNSSHSQISYAVFCLKKKTTNQALEVHKREYPRSNAVVLVYLLKL